MLYEVITTKIGFDSARKKAYRCRRTLRIKEKEIHILRHVTRYGGEAGAVGESGFGIGFSA